jgi:hypothetical protein
VIWIDFDPEDYGARHAPRQRLRPGVAGLLRSPASFLAHAQSISPADEV